MTVLAAAVFILAAGIAAVVTWATLRRDISAIQALRQALVRCPAVMDVRVTVTEHTPQALRAAAGLGGNVVTTSAFGATPTVNARWVAPQPDRALPLAA